MGEETRSVFERRSHADISSFEITFSSHASCIRSNPYLFLKTLAGDYDSQSGEKKTEEYKLAHPEIEKLPKLKELSAE